MTWGQWLTLLSGLIAIIQAVIWARYIPKGIGNFRRWKAELLLASFYKVTHMYLDNGNLLRMLASWAFNLTVALTASMAKRALPDQTHSQWLRLADFALSMIMINRLTIVLIEGCFLKPGLEDFEAFSNRVRQALTKSAPEKLDKFETWHSRMKDKI